MKQPASPLPWRADSERALPPAVIQDSADGLGVAECERAKGFRAHGEKDAEYIAHVANAYPRLVAELQYALSLERSKKYAARLRALLTELGEAT